MTFLFTETRNHALLALVIREAAKAAKENHGYVGRTAVQKIMYFLNAKGVPMGYRFDLYHYGPFSDQVISDIDWLVADDVIAEQSQKPEKYSNYAPGEGAEEFLAKFDQTLAPITNQVKETVSLLAPMKPEKLELLATLDYIYRQEKSAGKTPLKQAVVSRLQKVKPDKFTQEDVEQAYDEMIEVGLTEA